SDYRGAGYGYGYAMAKIDLCGAAEAFVTFGATRALAFGEDGRQETPLDGRTLNNVSYDQVTAFLIDQAQLDQEWAAMSSNARALVSGYAAGYSRYVAETDTDRALRPEACRNASWVRPISEADVLRRIRGWAMFLSSGQFYPELHEAAPPTGRT